MNNTVCLTPDEVKEIAREIQKLDGTGGYVLEQKSDVIIELQEIKTLLKQLVDILSVRRR